MDHESLPVGSDERMFALLDSLRPGAAAVQIQLEMMMLLNEVRDQALGLLADLDADPSLPDADETRAWALGVLARVEAEWAIN